MCMKTFFHIFKWRKVTIIFFNLSLFLSFSRQRDEMSIIEQMPSNKLFIQTHDWQATYSTHPSKFTCYIVVHTHTQSPILSTQRMSMMKRNNTSNTRKFDEMRMRAQDKKLVISTFSSCRHASDDRVIWCKIILFPLLTWGEEMERRQKPL